MKLLHILIYIILAPIIVMGYCLTGNPKQAKRFIQNEFEIFKQWFFENKDPRFKEFRGDL